MPALITGFCHAQAREWFCPCQSEGDSLASRPLMTDASQSTIKTKLFLMMILEIAIWGAWQIKIFSYMGMLGFTPDQQWLVGSAFGIASIVGIFFSNQFADRNFSAERFLAFSHVVGGIALVATAFQTQFWPFFACFVTYCLLYVPTISVTNSLAFTPRSARSLLSTGSSGYCLDSFSTFSQAAGGLLEASSLAPPMMSSRRSTRAP